MRRNVIPEFPVIKPMPVRKFDNIIRTNLILHHKGQHHEVFVIFAIYDKIGLDYLYWVFHINSIYMGNEKERYREVEHLPYMNLWVYHQ